MKEKAMSREVKGEEKIEKITERVGRKREDRVREKKERMQTLKLGKEAEKVSVGEGRIWKDKE